MPVGTFADSFSYTATDGHGDVSSATVNITVNIPAETVTAVNDSANAMRNHVVASGRRQRADQRRQRRRPDHGARGQPAAGYGQTTLARAPR